MYITFKVLYLVVLGVENKELVGSTYASAKEATRQRTFPSLQTFWTHHVAPPIHPTLPKVLEAEMRHFFFFYPTFTSNMVRGKPSDLTSIALIFNFLNWEKTVLPAPSLGSRREQNSPPVLTYPALLPRHLSWPWRSASDFVPAVKRMEEEVGSGGVRSITATLITVSAPKNGVCITLLIDCLTGDLPWLGQ